jgi:hypothetical protein
LRDKGVFYLMTILIAEIIDSLVNGHEYGGLVE